MANWKEKIGAKFGVEVPQEESPRPQKNYSSNQRNSQSQKSYSSRSGNYQPQRNSSTRQNNYQPQNFSSGSATAPYNFVSLPEKVLPAQFENVDGFREHIQNNGKLSGEILLNIETSTPFFTYGNGSKSFAPIDVPIIPGSSLRGMLKNIFKVVTCGAFRGQTNSQGKGEDFNDEHIYFRCLMATKNSPAWMSDLNKLYNDRMVRNERDKKGKNHLVKNASPGFLIRTKDGKTFIAPSIYTTDRKDDRILIREYEKKFNVKIPEKKSSHVEWRGTTAYIITGSQKAYRLHEEAAYKKLSDDEKKRAGKQFIRYTKLEYVDWCREHWLEIPDEVLSSYRHDRNRKGVDLFKDKGILDSKQLEKKLEGLGKSLSSNIETLIPCHYLKDGETVTTFGHGQCFRIPYQKRIGDAVKISGNDVVDFADAVFGCAELWSSRVYFDDAVPVEKISELPEERAHLLMPPNPTSYQLYLKQNPKNNTLTHWDKQDAQIRGYKFYWHNAELDWHASKSELENDAKRNPSERLIKKMTPLDKSNKFKAKIRFKNLSKVELGALLMTFNLDGLQTAAYKIGQGKPFGFGSIKINPTLRVEDETTYTELFNEDGWQNPYREKDPAEYLDAFKNYLEHCGMKATWQKVMDELKEILDWSKSKRKDWSEKVKSMSGDVSQEDGVDERFKQRMPLPTIFKVVK